MSSGSTYLDCVTQFGTELTALQEKVTFLTAAYIDIDAFAKLERGFVPSEARQMKPHLVVINERLGSLSTAWSRLAEKEGLPTDPAKD